VCEDFAAIQIPVYAIGGWTDGYTNAIPRLLEHLAVPRKGLIGPWAHAYPHFALPGPQIGYLQDTLRWWDHWLKGDDTGVMDEPMLHAWMTDSVKPASHHETLPGRWVAEPSWPPPSRETRPLFLTDDGLSVEPGALVGRGICTPLSLGRKSGSWCPFGRGEDQAGDQRDDDAVSVVFDSGELDETVEILGAPMLTLEIACDKPVATLVARLCDLRPDGESLRVSFGVLNLTHRDSHAEPSPLVPGQRYRVQIKLNDAGASFPAGHRLRLALSTSYWPMVWPAPETATVTILGGTLELPGRPLLPVDPLQPMPRAETAPPERPRQVRPGVMRFDRIGLEVGNEWTFRHDIRDDDPLSALAEMRRTMTVAREDWRVRIETSMRMTCSREAFRLEASMRAFEGDQEVTTRRWDQSIPRDMV